MNKEPLLTISQVASFLQVAEETVRRYVRSGNLKHIKLGRQIRFKSEHINDFLNSFADVDLGEQPEVPEEQSITQDAEQNEQLDLFDGEYL